MLFQLVKLLLTCLYLLELMLVFITFHFVVYHISISDFIVKALVPIKSGMAKYVRNVKEKVCAVVYFHHLLNMPFQK